MRSRRRALRKRYGRAGVISQPGELRIQKKKLAELMSPWGSDMSYGRGSGSIGAVGSFYWDDHKYPDKKFVEYAIEEAERCIPLARAGAHGWTKKDARDLERIAGGLRYWLRKDCP